MIWTFDGSGEWQAESKITATDKAIPAFHDPTEFCRLYWKVVVREDGIFSIGDTDAELIRAAIPLSSECFFASLVLAKAWCERQEEHIVPIVG